MGTGHVSDKCDARLNEFLADLVLVAKGGYANKDPAPIFCSSRHRCLAFSWIVRSMCRARLLEMMFGHVVLPEAGPSQVSKAKPSWAWPGRQVRDE